jgi:hypothetical protein
MWGGGGTEAMRFGKLTAEARFIEGFKHLGVSSFDEPAAEAALEHAKVVADYSLRRGSKAFEFSAKDHAQENGFAAIADPDKSPLHLSLGWLAPGENDPSTAQKEELDLTEEIAKDKARSIGGAFRVYSEPVLTYPYVAPVFEIGFQKKMPADLKKMLHSLGYF